MKNWTFHCPHPRLGTSRWTCAMILSLLPCISQKKKMEGKKKKKGERKKKERKTSNENELMVMYKHMDTHLTMPHTLPPPPSFSLENCLTLSSLPVPVLCHTKCKSLIQYKLVVNDVEKKRNHSCKLIVPLLWKTKKGFVLLVHMFLLLLWFCLMLLCYASQNQKFWGLCLSFNGHFALCIDEMWCHNGYFFVPFFINALNIC